MIDDPEQLRARAAGMRARAERAQFPETKQGLLRIAGDYAELAKRAEQRIAWWRAKHGVSEDTVDAPPVQPAASEDRLGSETEPEGHAL
jgi:hypothetical protein